VVEELERFKRSRRGVSRLHYHMQMMTS